MSAQLQITIGTMPDAKLLDARIREKAARLERFYPELIACRIVAEAPERPAHGKQYRVRLNIAVPRSEIMVSRDHDEDIYVALREAFDAARRQLEDYARRREESAAGHESAVTLSAFDGTARE
jgi:ribosomal subunit interface protein